MRIEPKRGSEDSDRSRRNPIGDSPFDYLAGMTADDIAREHERRRREAWAISNRAALDVDTSADRTPRRDPS